MNLELMIGVTRQCNFACAHCLRGDAENLSFKVEYLKEFFDNNPEHNYISSITFTGGEPFLKVDLLHEILDFFEDRNIEIGNYYIATNGSVFSTEVINFIFRLHSFCTDNGISYVNISNSPFHQREAKRKKKWIPSEIDDILQDIDFNFEDYGIPYDSIRIEKEDGSHYTNLIQEGRAKGIGKRQPSHVLDMEEDDTLFIHLNEEGKVLPNYCDFSFETQREKNLKSTKEFVIKDSLDYILNF